MRAGKGFSLIELLIGAGLLALFMTSIVGTLYYCNRYLKTADAKIAAQGQCLQATMWLSRTINESTMEATTVAPGLGVCFASPRSPGSGEITFLAGKLLWKQTMAYYRTVDPDGFGPEGGDDFGQLHAGQLNSLPNGTRAIVVPSGSVVSGSKSRWRAMASPMRAKIGAATVPP